MKLKGVVKKVMLTSETLCCTTCNTEVQSAIFGDQMAPTILALLMIFVVLTTCVLGFIHVYARNHNRIAQPGYFTNPVPLLRAALVLGIGIGGFIDGILFHQVLQRHQMLSNQIPPVTLVAKSVNMFWDGIFHAGMLIVVLVGVILMWKMNRMNTLDTSGRILVAGFFVGWGLFNIAEGLIDHHIFKLHNVRELGHDQSIWNYSFLIVSAAFLFLGIFLIRSHTSPKTIPETIYKSTQ